MSSVHNVADFCETLGRRQRDSTHFLLLALYRLIMHGVYMLTIKNSNGSEFSTF